MCGVLLNRQIAADLEAALNEKPRAQRPRIVATYKHQRGSVLNSGWMHKDAVGKKFAVRMYRVCRPVKPKKNEPRAFAGGALLPPLRGELPA